MPESTSTTGRSKGRETLDDWLKRQEARPCACGCGELVIPKKSHHRSGIPKYIQGHHVRVKHSNYRGVDKWVSSEQGKHFCVCGCNQPIKIQAPHHRNGIPRYLPNHHPRPSLGIGSDHPNFRKDRDRMRRGGADFTPATRAAIRERCGGKCVRCRSSGKLEYDHIVPVTDGGGAEASNGQLLCRECHRLKTLFEHVLLRSPDGIRRFFRSLIAFVEFAEQEFICNADNRNTANIP